MTRFILILGFISSLAFSEQIDFNNKQTEWVCTALFMNYFDGCIDANTGPSYTEERIKEIVADCKAKGKVNTRRFRLCEKVKFDDEP